MPSPRTTIGTGAPNRTQAIDRGTVPEVARAAIVVVVRPTRSAIGPGDDRADRPGRDDDERASGRRALGSFTPAAAKLATRNSGIHVHIANSSHMWPEVADRLASRTDGSRKAARGDLEREPRGGDVERTGPHGEATTSSAPATARDAGGGDRPLASRRRAQATDGPEQEGQRGAERQRADDRADGQPAIAPEPAGDELDRDRIDRGQRRRRSGSGTAPPWPRSVASQANPRLASRRASGAQRRRAVGPGTTSGRPDRGEADRRRRRSPSWTATVRNGSPSPSSPHSARRVGATADGGERRRHRAGACRREMRQLRPAPGRGSPRSSITSGQGRHRVHDARPGQDLGAIGAPGDAAERGDRLVRRGPR